MRATVLALLSVLAFGPLAMAHEGHEHKVVGIVATVHESQVDVDVAGKASTVTLNAETRILRGKAAAEADDIRTGDRIAVTATETKDKAGKVILLASEVLLGT